AGLVVARLSQRAGSKRSFLGRRLYSSRAAAFFRIGGPHDDRLVRRRSVRPLSYHWTPRRSVRQVSPLVADGDDRRDFDGRRLGFLPRQALVAVGTADDGHVRETAAPAPPAAASRRRGGNPN